MTLLKRIICSVIILSTTIISTKAAADVSLSLSSSNQLKFATNWLYTNITASAAIINERFLFNPTNYGFSQTASGAVNSLALSNTIKLASAVNGIVFLSSGTYTNSALDITASNFRLMGSARLVPSGIATQWLKFTGTNITVGGEGSSLDIDGNDLVMQLVTIGAYSGQIKINNNILRNGRVTALNDPSANVSNSVNVAWGVRFLAGVTNSEIAENFIYDIAYDDTRTYLNGDGRSACYIQLAPGGSTATVESNAIKNIKIRDNWFIASRSVDWNNKPDLDGIRIQNMQSDVLTNNAIRVFNNHFIGQSWKGVKAQASDVHVYNNSFLSFGDVAVGGTNVVPRSAIEFFGRHSSAVGNKLGGVYEWAIAGFGDIIHGQMIGLNIANNLITMPETLAMGSRGIFLKSVSDSVIQGNMISAASIGIRAQGYCDNNVFSGNNIGTNNTAAILFIVESDMADAWYNMSPSNNVVRATVASRGTRGVWASTGARKIDIEKPTGNTTSPIVRASDVTGDGYNAGNVEITAADINWNLGNRFYKAIGADTTFTFTGAGTGQEISVRILATGAFTNVWPTVTWEGGAYPVQTSSKTDFYKFYYDGTNYFGSASQDY